MSTIQVTVSGDREVLQIISGFIDRGHDLRPVLELIGARMVERTKKRFDTATGPDGRPWAPNATSTVERFVSSFGGSRKKDGALSAKGRARAGGKKPLIGETGALRTTINYQVAGGDVVNIGSPMMYARVQQEGAGRGQFGNLPFKTKRGTFPVPWGDIPARPFLGFSDDDQAEIVDIVRSYLKPAEN
ncbi:MAG: phage virion morphogenesis protein [Burkholderiaceae bacterium]|jgi:phage gpG-like protein|nr:phage virion morphogenesis protein [Burkholderiaceae bacterium]